MIIRNFHLIKRLSYFLQRTHSDNYEYITLKIVYFPLGKMNEFKQIILTVLIFISELSMKK